MVKIRSTAEDKECYDDGCECNYPYRRRHKHIITQDGIYVIFITDNIKDKEVYYADTW